MDRFGEWRPIEPAADDDDKTTPQPAAAKPAEAAKSAANVVGGRLIGLLAAGVLAVVGAVLWVGSAGARPSLELSGKAAYFEVEPSSSAASGSMPAETIEPEIVVDVEGAVVRPGLHRLPSGSRVGDAIAIAGGYSPQIDIDAAATRLNLAEALVDGAKVHVPARGEATLATPPREASVGDATGPGGLIDINTATAEQLDTLPGIGPVTAAKVIAAREQAPFASVDELLSREVVGASTFEKIRSLVTVGP
ncbi:MAG: ComEA family DNA-binding protein [Chloroflexota bacterium]